GLHFGMPIYRQQAVIRQVERLGGKVRTIPGGPEWLRPRLGDERMKLFDRVTRVDLNDTQANDVTLSQVASLAQLEWLELDSTPVTDAGLAHLIELKHLERLHLYRTEITNVGLAHLAEMKSLKV